MEGYAAASVAANRKILRKRSFRNIEIKVPRAKKKIVRNAIEQQQQALKMKRIGQRKNIRVTLILLGLLMLGISGTLYLLSGWF